MGTSKIYRFLLTVISGLLTAVPFLFNAASYIAWVSIIPFFILLVGVYGKGRGGPAAAYRLGLLFYMSFYLIVYHWFFYLYPLEFTGMSKGSAICVVLAAWIGIPLLQSSVFALLPLFFTLLCRTAVIKKYRILQPLALSALWIISEWAQTQTWAGVPWGRLSVGQYTNLAVIQSASLFGSYFISFIIVFVNALIASALIDKKRRKTLCSIAVLTFASNIVYGGIALNTQNYETGEPVTAAVIQGNISSYEKWTSASRYDILRKYENLTRKAADEGARLIVWPETAIAYNLFDSPDNTQRLVNLAADTGADLIVGTFVRETVDGENRSYNALVAIGKEGRILPYVYKKRHLVPFGEYVPMESVISALIPPLAALDMFSDAIEPGEGSMLMQIGDMTVGSLICFDSIYEELTRESVTDGAELIVLSTNDSWFFDSPAVYQHNGHAVMRAVESGRYIVRAANTGISSIISPSGEILKQIVPLIDGYATADVYLRDDLTLYMRTGNIIVAAAAAYLLIIAFSPVCMMIKRKINKPC